MSEPRSPTREKTPAMAFSRVELTLDSGAGCAGTVSDHMIRAGLVVPYTRGVRAGWDWSNFPLEQRNPFHLAPEA